MPFPLYLGKLFHQVLIQISPPLESPPALFTLLTVSFNSLAVPVTLTKIQTLQRQRLCTHKLPILQTKVRLNQWFSCLSIRWFNKIVHNVLRISLLCTPLTNTPLSPSSLLFSTVWASAFLFRVLQNFYTLPKFKLWVGSPDLKKAVSCLYLCFWPSPPYPSIWHWVLPIRPMSIKVFSNCFLWLYTFALPPRETTGSHLIYFFWLLNWSKNA